MESSEKRADIQGLLRRLPSVDELIPLLRHEEPNGVSDAAVAEALRRAVEDRRARLLAAHKTESGTVGGGEPTREALREDVLQRARDLLAADRRPSFRDVINATGIVLHTNLGRAPLSRAASEALRSVGEGYANLEFDLSTGRRGRRGPGIEELLRRLTGAEAAIAVNNNAAAVMFAILAMAEGREVVVSRGELIEIGGGFRVPEIMLQSGAELVEVGTTNKTRISDFERAIGPETALLLKAHTSNFRIVGFTEEVPRADLAALAHRHGIPVLEDLGSGCLVKIPGLPDEPLVADSIADGVDVVTFSGDKLLGGPQAGIIVGRREWVDRMRTHPLMRILRLDKLTLAALEATLRAYLDPERALREVPALRMLSDPPETVERRAAALIEAVGPEAAKKLGAGIVEVKGQVGGGAMPLAEIVSRAVALAPAGLSADETETRLRAADPPVIARIQDDRVLLDMRCVREEEIAPLAAILRNLAAGAA